MRRKDREIADFDEQYAILSRLDTIRVAMFDGEYPYVVPVSFGCEKRDGRAVLYFHSAKAGHKVDALAADPHVCIEGDVTFKVEPTDHGITTRYESVIGRGLCELVEDEAEKIRGLRLLCGHYGFMNYDLAGCRGLPMVNVYRITVERLTAKRNAPLDA